MHDRTQLSSGRGTPAERLRLIFPAKLLADVDAGGAEEALNSMSHVLISKRASYAALKRHHGADHPATEAASRELRETALARHITRLVDAAPPLTEEQRARLAALLVNGGGHGAAA